MNITTSWFLARRFIRSFAYDKSVSIMIKVCFLSICVGTFALALIVAIMQGFEHETYRKMQGTHADLIIRSPKLPLNVNKITELLRKDYGNLIDHASPVSLAHAMLQSQEHPSLTSLVVIMGVDPQSFAATTTIADSLTSPSGSDLQQLLTTGSIVIGERLSRNLASPVGSMAAILFSPDAPQSRTITFEQQKAIISGLFKTGIEEFDAHIILCSQNFFEEIFPEQEIFQINLKLNPKAQETSVINSLKKRLNLDVFSWKELYPALVSALVLEKYAMFIIGALVALVASMNLISLLFMYLNQRQLDIAILLTYGTPTSAIIQTFILLGMSIACTAALTGILLAYLATLLLNYYPFIRLPDVYYVTYLPAQMSFTLCITVFITVAVLSLISSWLSARRVLQLPVASLIKGKI